MTNRLSPEVFTAKVAQLMPRRRAGECDIELAKLFASCGWTQQEIAQQLGRSQPWVNQRLLFGRFMNWQERIIASRYNHSQAGGDEIIASRYNGSRPGHNGGQQRLFTEFEFRRLWRAGDREQTDEARFEEVLRHFETASSDPVVRPSRALTAEVIVHFADGRSHSVDVIANRLGCNEALAEAAAKACARAPYNATVEFRHLGRKRAYRIFRAEKLIPFLEIETKLGPHIAELIEQGNRNMTTISPGGVSSAAHALKRQLDAWRS